MITLDQMIRELNFQGQATYLPPKYLKDIEANRIFIAKDKETTLPNPNEFLTQEDNFLIHSKQGISFEPPGGELTRLLENTLGTSFTQANLPDFGRTIPKALIEDLEIAQNVEIRIQGSKISITLENTPYAPLCTETQKLNRISSSVGCPLCSALACALAKSTGNPIIIEKEETDQNNRTIVVEYRVLNEK